MPLNTAMTARTATGLVVAITCTLMLATMGWAVAVLVFALLLSFVVWLGRPAQPATKRTLALYVTAVVVQSAHLAEEYRAGFYRLFPPVLGRPPWSARQFLLFNLVWLA